jgi:hypothetical protein
LEVRVIVVIFDMKVSDSTGKRRVGRGGMSAKRVFEIRAEWDAEAGVWWCSNDELPLTTEAPTFEQMVARVLEIAPEIAAENGLAAPGDEIELHVVAERTEAVPVITAA